MNKFLCLGVMVCATAYVQAGEGYIKGPFKSNLSNSLEKKRIEDHLDTLPLSRSTEIHILGRAVQRKKSFVLRDGQISSGSSSSGTISSGSSPDLTAQSMLAHLYPGEQGEGYSRGKLSIDPQKEAMNTLLSLFPGQHGNGQ